MRLCALSVSVCLLITAALAPTTAPAATAQDGDAPVTHPLSIPTSLPPLRGPDVSAQSVIDEDTRVRVTATTDVPWRHIVDLEVFFPSFGAQCSGFFIGPMVVATAAHCIYDEVDGWATAVAVIPARDGGTQPFGFDWAAGVAAPSGWVSSGAPEYDYAALAMPDSTLGDLAGQFEYAAPGDVFLPAVNIAGYPGDKYDVCTVDGGCTMWAGDGFALASGDFVHHVVDTYGGQSGAPIWVYDGVDRTVIGIHTQGMGGSCLPDSNCGTRIDQAMIDFFAPFGANPPAPDTSAPDVEITAPANGGNVSGASVAIDAEPWDLSGVQKVQFWIDGTYLGFDASEPYSKSFNSTVLTNGTHAVKVRAYDNAGNASAVITHSVNVANSDAVPPTVSISAPASGAVVSGTSVALSASASDAASGVQKVQFWVDGTYLGFDASAPYSKTFDSTALTNGAHTLKARAYDNAGNASGIVARTVYVTNGDTAAPSVSISAPANGAVVSGAGVAFSASASDASGVQKVQFWVDGTYLGFDASAPYSKTFDSTALTNGAHTLKARAYDNAGNASGIVTRTVYVTNGDTTAPSVSITSHTSGAVVSGASVTIVASASDESGVQKVQFWVDGTYLGFDTSAAYSKTFDSTALTNGAHTLQVRAYDNAGNVSAVTSIPVTVSN
jgi:V8-like Glu-specific endopeptidase